MPAPARRHFEYDRGEKLDHYRQMPALREVVLVSHREPAVEVWRRRESGVWSSEVARAGETASLLSIGCALVVDDLYRGLPAPGPARSEGAG